MPFFCKKFKIVKQMKKIAKSLHSFLIISVLLSFCLPVIGQEFNSDSLKIKFTEYIEKEMKSRKITGFSIALVDDQKTIWSEGFGYGNKSENIKADKNSVYRIGSVSKVFTATAIMQLVDQGKINLDESIDKYIPEFRINSHFENPGKITVRSLLTHESGLQSDYYSNNWWFDNPLPDNYQFEYMKLPEMIKDEYVVTQPWHHFSYSNLAFSLLGNIITNVSGKDYSDYLEDHIFEPLGMNNSSAILNDRVKDNMTMGYYGKEEVSTPFIRDLAAGSILSSVEDMSSFMKMIFADGNYNGNQVLSEHTLNLMFEQQNKDVELDLDFKIGITYWLINPLEINEVQPALHYGDLPPYHAMLLVIPEYKIGAVAMTNSQSGQGFSRTVIIKLLQEVLKMKHGFEVTEEIYKERETIKLPDDKLEKYDGYYSTIYGMFKLKNNSVNLIKPIAKAKLLPYAEDNFSLKIKAFGIPVAKGFSNAVKMSYLDREDNDLMAIYVDGTFMAYGQKVQPVKIPDSWQNRFGQYEISNIDFESYDKITQLSQPKSAELNIDKTGFMMLSIKYGEGVQKKPLKPIDDEKAIIYGLGRNLGETIRVIEKNGEEIILFSGYELKKMK